MLKIVLLYFLVNILFCSAVDETTDPMDTIQPLQVLQNDAEKLAKCYDENLNMKIERLERTSKIFEDIIERVITQESPNSVEQVPIAQNMTLYFKLLRQTQLDMKADLNELKRNFMHLNESNEMFKKEMLSLARNISNSNEIQMKSQLKLLSIKDLELENEPNDQNDNDDYDKHLNCLKKCSGNDKLPGNCAEAVVDSPFKDDMHAIKLPGRDLLRPFYVFCIFENKNENPWTVIQRRYDGSENFYRKWIDYKHGFGNISGEYWLGLERLHAMTKSQPHELWIFLLNSKGQKTSLKYSNFSIASEDEDYKLNFDRRVTRTDDFFSKHNNRTFVTYDRDDITGCAKYYGSGWWYLGCFYCNLNGAYKALSDGKIYEGIQWTNALDGSPKYVHMAIRAI